jgi:hypothetical protein
MRYTSTVLYGRRGSKRVQPCYDGTGDRLLGGPVTCELLNRTKAATGTGSRYTTCGFVLFICLSHFVGVGS